MGRRGRASVWTNLLVQVDESSHCAQGREMILSAGCPSKRGEEGEESKGGVHLEDRPNPGEERLG
jgi:hypothetical protein